MGKLNPIKTDGYFHLSSRNTYILDTYFDEKTSNYITAYYKNNEGSPEYVEVGRTKDKDQAIFNHRVCQSTKFIEENYRKEIIDRGST